MWVRTWVELFLTYYPGESKNYKTFCLSIYCVSNQTAKPKIWLLKTAIATPCESQIYSVCQWNGVQRTLPRKIGRQTLDSRAHTRLVVFFTSHPFHTAMYSVNRVRVGASAGVDSITRLQRGFPTVKWKTLKTSLSLFTFLFSSPSMACSAVPTIHSFQSRDYNR